VIDGAKSTTDFIRINVNSKDVRCIYRELDIGVAAHKALANCKLGGLDKMRFQMHCIVFLASTSKKIVERSPLKYNIVQAFIMLCA